MLELHFWRMIIRLFMQSFQKMKLILSDIKWVVSQNTKNQWKIRKPLRSQRKNTTLCDLSDLSSVFFMTGRHIIQLLQNVWISHGFVKISRIAHMMLGGTMKFHCFKYSLWRKIKFIFVLFVAVITYWLYFWWYGWVAAYMTIFLFIFFIFVFIPRCITLFAVWVHWI